MGQRDRGTLRVEENVPLHELVDGGLALLQEHGLLRDVGEGRAGGRIAGVEFRRRKLAKG